MQQTHCGMHASIFSHIWTTRGAGTLVYVRVGSGRFLAGEDICGATDHFQRFWSGCGRKRVIQLLRRSCWITLSRPLGIILPKRIHPGIPPISPRRRRDWAGLHAADTLRHACIDFFHIFGRPGEPAVWFMSESGAVGSWQARTYVGLPITSSGFEAAAGVRGLNYWHAWCRPMEEE